MQRMLRPYEAASRTVLDLHDLVAAHVTGLNEAKRVIHAEGWENANVALREHLRGRADRLGGERGLEGRDGLEERKGSDGLHHGGVCAHRGASAQSRDS